MSLDIEFTYKGFRTYYDNLNKDWCCSGLRIRTNSVEQMKSKIDKIDRAERDGGNLPVVVISGGTWSKDKRKGRLTSLIDEENAWVVYDGDSFRSREKVKLKLIVPLIGTTAIEFARICQNMSVNDTEIKKLQNSNDDLYKKIIDLPKVTKELIQEYKIAQVEKDL